MRILCIKFVFDCLYFYVYGNTAFLKNFTMEQFLWPLMCVCVCVCAYTSFFDWVSWAYSTAHILIKNPYPVISKCCLNLDYIEFLKIYLSILAFRRGYSNFKEYQDKNVELCIKTRVWSDGEQTRVDKALYWCHRHPFID